MSAEDKKDLNKKRVQLEAIPEYIQAQDRDVIHAWKAWRAMTYRIDNHPNRFYISVVPNKEEPITMDLKMPVGLTLKRAKIHGIQKEDIDKMTVYSKEIKQLQNKKTSLCAVWKGKVFGKRRGEEGLLELKSAEMIEMFGKFYSIEEIMKIIQSQWGYTVRHMELQKFFQKHKEKINSKKAEYILAGKEIRLATDAGRMEVLSKIAWEMEQKFDKTKSIEVSKELRATVEQIRKEVKGDELRLTIDGKIDINATIQANQTVHEALQKLPINMIVIGLTAAKQGINPAQLIGSLANSYYSKFNGFNKLSDKKEIQLPGQYIKTYNWDEIRMKNEEQMVDVEAIDVYEEAIPVVEKVIVEDKKQQMLNMLRQMKEPS